MVEKKRIEMPSAPPARPAVTAKQAPLSNAKEEESPTRRSAPKGPCTLNVPMEYPSIQYALDAARSGDTVLVHPGRYREAIEFKSGVHLRGTDRDGCVVLLLSGANTVIKASNCSNGCIECLTITNEGALIANEATWLPDGISIMASSVHVVGCRVHKMPGVGIYVSERGAEPILKNNWCFANGQNGLDFAAGTGGIAEENLLELNKQNGIAVAGSETAPTLRNNKIRQNGNCGILFEEGCRGVADSNLLESNSASGIEVSGLWTSPTLLKNQARCNGKFGILFNHSSSGEAERNQFDANINSGIAVLHEGTSVSLKNNVARENGRSGIYFGKGSGGMAQGNVLENNKGDGITVFNEDTSPILRANVCRNNGDCGIWIQKASSPTVLPDNIIERNKNGGLKRGT